MNKFYNFINLEGEDTTVLHILDEIGFFGVTAREFFDELSAVTTKNLLVKINSPGGGLFEGLAIYHGLKEHKANVTTRVEGIAASIASIILMAGDTIEMHENSFIFFHDPLVPIRGNSTALRKEAEELDKTKESLLSILESQSGKDREEISKILSDETLYTALEALENGFITDILPEKQVAACANITNFYPNLKNVLPDMTSGEQGNKENNPKTNMKTPEELQKELDTAMTRITTLEANAQTEKQNYESKLKTAETNARQKVVDAENTRRQQIVDISQKYNKGGDLDSITIEALSGNTKPDDFKDKVLDVINQRTTRQPLKPNTNPPSGGSKQEGDKLNLSESEEALLEEYRNASDANARIRIYQNNRKGILELQQKGALTDA